MTLFDKFKNDLNGSVSTMFGVTITCVLIGVGAALDFSMLEKQKQSLQDAVDAAALAVVITDKEQKMEREKYAESHISENFEGKFEFSLKTSGRSVEVTATSDYDTMLMGMFGKKRIPISVSSAAEAGIGGNLNVVLALDTTRSMLGSRLTGLQAAAADFIYEVEEADNNEGNSKIGIVPFANHVRINMSYEGETWLDVPPDRQNTYTTVDWDASTNCRYEYRGERRVTRCDETVLHERTNTVRWNGCMGYRPDGHDTSAYFNTHRFKGVAGSGSCTANYNFMSPLTDDFDQLKTSILDLEVYGETYIPAGLTWGWRLLQEEALFTEATIDPAEPVSKVLVLMTDGSNTTSVRGTVNGWDGLYAWGVSEQGPAEYAEDRAIADGVTLQMCEDIKADGIRVVTVAFEVGDIDTKATLKTCASKDSDFYDAIDSEELKAAFNKIGSGLSSIRLTQ